MKLEYLYIDGYKGLKRLKLQFKEQTGAVPVDFLIGCNGSGKSSVLEAVGLIFTRIMQNELPGFIFELKYRMPDGTGIYVKPQKKGFCDASGRRRIATPPSSHATYAIMSMKAGKPVYIESYMWNWKKMGKPGSYILYQMSICRIGSFLIVPGLTVLWKIS